MEHHVQPNPAISLADFTCILQTNLSTVTLGQPLLDSNAISRLDTELNHNPFSTISTSGLDLKRLDAIGTSLWNICTQLIATRCHIPADVQVLAKVRALAFALLNVAVPSKLLGWIRSVSLALTAAQTCIATQQFDIALNILSVAAARLQTIQPSHLGLDVSLNFTLTTKYWLLRIRLAAAQKRLDIAEHHWSQISAPFLIPDCKMVLEACYFVGESAILHDPASAILWLQRADETLQHLDVATGMNFPDYNDWNLVIQHSLAVACLPNKTPDSSAIFFKKINNLKGLYMDHPAVVLFDLTLGSLQPTIQSVVQVFQDTVTRMKITDANMTTIFQFVHSLGQKDPNAAIEAINILLLLPLPTREWTEKCFVAFVVLLARSTEWDSTRIRALQDVIKALEHRGYPSISEGPAQATVMCLWKITGAALLKNDYRSAVAWLRICSDPKIFNKCSDDIQRMIQMKLIACYVQSGDLVSARDLLARGLVQSQHDCKRMYLAYKLDLLEGKYCTNHFILGFPSYPILHKQMSLLSCAMEAQRLRKPAEVLSCLDQLIQCSNNDDIYHHDFSAAEHHMFLICLIINELEDYCSAEFYRRVDTVLSSALSYARGNNRFEGSEQDVSATQMQWLYQATYRVGLKLVWHRQLPLLLKALKCSHEFTLLYRQVADTEGRSKAPRPHFFALNHIRILAYSDAARRETDRDKKRTQYRCVRTCFKVLDNLVGWEDGEEKPTPISASLEEKQHATGQFFNFEATLHLGIWDEILEMCEDDRKFPKSQFYLQMIDMIIQMDCPATVAVKLMKRIIYRLIEKMEDSPMDRVFYAMRMPRYLHYLFSLASANVPADPLATAGILLQMNDPVLAEEVLDRIYKLAKTEADKEVVENAQANMNTLQNGTEIYTIDGKNPFPAPELAQVAVLAFNKAVDFYRTTRDEECYYWAQRALDIARLVPGSEGETLVATITERLGTLI